MRAVMRGLSGGRGQRSGMVFDQTQLTAKRGSLELDLLLHMEMRARGNRQFVLAIDGRCGGNPDAYQQNKKRGPKANSPQSAP